MKLRHQLPFFLAVLSGLAWAATAGSVPGDSALIRQRIDALLKLRRKPELLPVDPPNPFVLVAAPALATGAGPAREGPPALGAPETAPARAAEDATTTELLARFASRLRITGLIRLKDQVHIIINDSPWKEGDSLIVDRSGGRIVQLQVVRIQPGQLTLRLDDAELVLRF